MALRCCHFVEACSQKRRRPEGYRCPCLRVAAQHDVCKHCEFFADPNLIVHVTIRPRCITRSAKLVSRAKVVVTVHSDQGTHARVGTGLEWRMTDQCTVAHAAARSLHSWSHRTVDVIHTESHRYRPNGRASVRRALGWPQDLIVIILHGSMAGRASHLIGACGVSATKIRCNLLIVGYGRNGPSRTPRNTAWARRDVVQLLGTF